MKAQSILLHRDYLLHYPEMLTQLQDGQTHTHVNKSRTYPYNSRKRHHLPPEVEEVPSVRTDGTG
jgi:hypothetical protein